MASHVSGTRSGAARRTTSLVFARGLLAFAGVMMVVGGVLNVLQGITAIANDEVFVATPKYAYQFDLTSWGWIHLVLGVLVTVAGLALFTGATWARVVGVVLASLLIVANFMYLPYYPVWSVVLVALHAFVIWALCVAPRRSDART
ncbi:DUF7144 family membrane protein [Streptomyces cellulosae]|uniref:DUF7144 family membrane protein n=1 Tax=Streptomyces cellulosae TaxID=1968 RepID=UPI0004CA9EDD|nr:hypothetical protein [Streptomyces cellulosae]